MSVKVQLLTEAVITHENEPLMPVTQANFRIMLMYFRLYLFKSKGILTILSCNLNVSKISFKKSGKAINLDLARTQKGHKLEYVGPHIALVVMHRVI